MKRFFDQLRRSPWVGAAWMLVLALAVRYGVFYLGNGYFTLLFFRAGLYDGAATVPGWAVFLSAAGNGFLAIAAALIVLFGIAMPAEEKPTRILLYGALGCGAAVVSAGVLLLADSVRYSPAGFSAADAVNLLGIVAWSFAAAICASKTGSRVPGDRRWLRALAAAIAFAALAPVPGGGWLYLINLLLAGAVFGMADGEGSTALSAGFVAWALAWEGAFGAFTGRGLLRTVSEDWLVGTTPAGGGLLTLILVGCLVIQTIAKRKNRR